MAIRGKSRAEILARHQVLVYGPATLARPPAQKREALYFDVLDAIRRHYADAELAGGADRDVAAVLGAVAAIVCQAPGGGG